MTLVPRWRRGLGSHEAASPKRAGGRRKVESRPLAAFTADALAWLKRHLPFFDPFLDGPEPVGFHSRAFLELSYLTMLCLPRAKGPLDPRIEAFVGLIADVWARPEYREHTVRSPERLAWYLMPYLVLERAGRADHSYREVIQRLLDHGYPTAVEDPSFRHLAWRHLLDVGGFRHDVASYESLYRHTLLARTPSVAYFTRHDLNCFTHALFALSHVGSRVIDVIPRGQVPAVHRTLVNLLGVYLRLEDWDAVGELLLCCRCLRWAPPVVFETAWDALRRAQLPDGAVPGRFFSTRDRRVASHRQAYSFRHNYHPTVVAALTGFLSERWAPRV